MNLQTDIDILCQSLLLARHCASDTALNQNWIRNTSLSCGYGNCAWEERLPNVKKVAVMCHMALVYENEILPN